MSSELAQRFIKLPGYTILGKYKDDKLFLSTSTMAENATEILRDYKYLIAFNSKGETFAFITEIDQLIPAPGVDLYVRVDLSDFIPKSTCNLWHHERFWIKDIPVVKYPPPFKLKLLDGESASNITHEILKRNLDGAWVLLRLKEPFVHGYASVGVAIGEFRDLGIYKDEIIETQTDGVFLDTAHSHTNEPVGNARETATLFQIRWPDPNHDRVELWAACPNKWTDPKTTEKRPFARERSHFGVYRPNVSEGIHFKKSSRYFYIRPINHGSSTCKFRIQGYTGAEWGQDPYWGQTKDLSAKSRWYGMGNVNLRQLNGEGDINSVDVHMHEIIVPSQRQIILDYINIAPPGFDSAAGIGAVQCCDGNNSNDMVKAQCPVTNYTPGAGKCDAGFMKNLCKGDNLRLDACKTYCKHKNNYCDQEILAWAADDPALLQSNPEIVACFQPPSFYKKFFDDLFKQLPGLGATARQPHCTFLPCSNTNSIQTQAVKQQGTNCPNTVTCVQNFELNNDGSIKGNVTIKQDQICKGITDEPSDEDPPVDGNNNTMWIVIGVVGCFVVLLIIVLVIWLRK